MVDNIGIPQSATAQPQAGTAAPQNTEQRAEVRAERIADIKQSEEALVERNPEETRFEAVKQAAQNAAGNAYPIRDVRFTIYQERAQSGGIVYVTRFTNLESGEVELVREPELLLQGSGGKNLGTLLTTSV